MGNAYCVAIIFASCNLLAASNVADDSDFITIKGWGVHGFSGGLEIGYGWYETRSEADKAKTNMEQIQTTTGKYYDKVVIKPEERKVPKDKKLETGKLDKAKEFLANVKEAKEAVDKAKDIDKEGFGELLKIKERKFGDTVKEYKELLKKSFDQAMEVKKTLTIGIKNTTEAKFKEANNLIDKYNRDLVDFQSVMGPSFKTGFAPIARLQKDAGNAPMGPTPDEKLFIGTFTGTTIADVKSLFEIREGGKARIRREYSNGGVTDDEYRWEFDKTGGYGFGKMNIINEGVGIITTIFCEEDKNGKKKYKDQGGTVLSKE